VPGIPEPPIRHFCRDMSWETLRQFTLENHRKRQLCRNLTALKFQVTTPVSDQPLLRPWHSALLSLDSLQVSDQDSSYPLPLSRPPLREACPRLLNGDSGSGLSPEVFPTVSSQPFDTDAPRQIFFYQ